MPNGIMGTNLHDFRVWDARESYYLMAVQLPAHALAWFSFR
jgi:hypothetical protein